MCSGIARLKSRRHDVLTQEKLRRYNRLIVFETIEILTIPSHHVAYRKCNLGGIEEDSSVHRQNGRDNIQIFRNTSMNARKWKTI